MKFGFIGTGRMGGALARAVSRSGHELLLSDADATRSGELAKELGARATDNAGVMSEADYVFLGVKPQMMEQTLAPLTPVLAARETKPVLVSMAAGLTVATIRRMAGCDAPIIRIMPNTPVLLGQGMILYSLSESVTEELRDGFLNAMTAAGRLAPLTEEQMDAGCSVSGCGPAFAYLFMQALADGGVACGLDPKDALAYAAQMTAGAAAMVLETGESPAALKDAVCSPGGSTIEGVKVMENSEFHRILTETVQASYRRNRELGGQ